MNNLDYGKVFEVLVKETANYVKVNNLRAMVLGISTGSICECCGEINVCT